MAISKQTLNKINESLNADLMQFDETETQFDKRNHIDTHK